jgi:hypothetical protein
MLHTGTHDDASHTHTGAAPRIRKSSAPPVSATSHRSAPMFRPEPSAEQDDPRPRTPPKAAYKPRIYRATRYK